MNQLKSSRLLAWPLLFTLGLTSCSLPQKRGPSSEYQSLNHLITKLDSLGQLHQGDNLICQNKYRELYNELFSLVGEIVYSEMNEAKNSQDASEIKELINQSFLARLKLKESFASFTPGKECISAATDTFRALRYLEDYLIELESNKAGVGPQYVTLTGKGESYFLVNPKYADTFKSHEDLKSGDVILSRGNAYTSAAIARIGETDYQFSHLSFVYQDEETKKMHTTEAHIEIGSVVAPIEEHIHSGNARTLVFRYKDPEISHQASKYVYERVAREQKKKKNIQYDFGMDHFDDSKLYCSEVVSSGFKHVLPEEDYFPLFKSKFSKGMIPFVNRIGINVNEKNIDTYEVFSPGDIQFDPRFELVAEWRNPAKLVDNRYKDFILSKIFEKIEKEKYGFDEGFKIDATSKSLWILRRVPIVKKFLESKFPLNMNTTQLQLFMALDKVGEGIYQELEKIALNYSRPLTPKEIFDSIDHIFEQDLKTYKRYKKVGRVHGPKPKPVFHQWFHP